MLAGSRIVVDVWPFPMKLNVARMPLPSCMKIFAQGMLAPEYDFEKPWEGIRPRAGKMLKRIIRLRRFFDNLRSGCRGPNMISVLAI